MLGGFTSKLDKVMCAHKRWQSACIKTELSMIVQWNYSMIPNTVNLTQLKYVLSDNTLQWVKKKRKVFRTMELCWETCGTCCRTWNPLFEWKNALSWDQQIPCPGLVSDCEKKSRPVIVWFYFAQFCSPLLPSRDQPCQNSGIEYFYKEIEAIKIVTTGMSSLVGNDSS